MTGRNRESLKRYRANVCQCAHLTADSVTFAFIVTDAIMSIKYRLHKGPKLRWIICKDYHANLSVFHSRSSNTITDIKYWLYESLKMIKQELIHLGGRKCLPRTKVSQTASQGYIASPHGLCNQTGDDKRQIFYRQMIFYAGIISVYHG